MQSRTVRSVTLFLTLGLLSTAAATATAPTPTAPTATAQPMPSVRAQSSDLGDRLGDQPVAGLTPEVRLRKLHLVRPDLIPYPIQLDVYC